MQKNYDNDHHDHKQLRIYRGFKEEEIFWSNIGLNTYTRFMLRVKTLTVTLITYVIWMILFEFMYLYQNNPDYIKTKKSGNLSLA